MYLCFSEVKHFLTVELKDDIKEPVTNDHIQELMDETDKDGDKKISYRGKNLHFRFLKKE